MAKMLLLTTALSAAMVACGDDDGAGGGGVGGGAGGGAGGGVGGGAGGGVGGGGGMVAPVSISLRFAQLIPDAVPPLAGDAGVPDSDGGVAVAPGVRICLKVGAGWTAPNPSVEESPIGIPFRSISAYAPPQPVSGPVGVAVYAAPLFDAVTAADTAGDPCGFADASDDIDSLLPPTTIDPVALDFVTGGRYTALLTGLVNNSVAAVTGAGLRPCLAADGETAVDCPAPQLTVLTDDATTTAGKVKVRVINGVPNSSAPVDLCIAPGDMPTNFAPLLADADAVAVGEATDYVAIDPIAGPESLMATTRGPVALPPADGGADADAGVVLAPCAGLPAAFGSVPTDPTLLGLYTLANQQAEAVATLDADDTISIFLVGPVSATATVVPPPPDGYGFAVPVTDAP